MNFKKSHHPLLAWWKSGWWECSPTHKKAGVCAIMSMWLVHIREHVWTIGTCPTTILLPDCRVVGGAIRSMLRHCVFPQVVVLKQKCGYSCHGIDLGGGGSFSQRNKTLKGLAQVNIVKCSWYDVKICGEVLYK